MPRKEMNYQNTTIYKIQHIEKEDLLYVGHTTDFVQRKHQHKHSSNHEGNRNYNCKLYTMIRENGGWNQFKMIEVKKNPCKDQREACAEEDKCMKELKANMNSRGSILDVKRKNDLANEKHICICGCIYTHKHKTRHERSQRHIQGVKALTE